MTRSHQIQNSSPICVFRLGDVVALWSPFRRECRKTKGIRIDAAVRGLKGIPYHDSEHQPALLTITNAITRRYALYAARSLDTALTLTGSGKSASAVTHTLERLHRLLREVAY